MSIRPPRQGIFQVEPLHTSCSSLPTRLSNFYPWLSPLSPPFHPQPLTHLPPPTRTQGLLHRNVIAYFGYCIAARAERSRERLDLWAVITYVNVDVASLVSLVLCCVASWYCVHPIFLFLRLVPPLFACTTLLFLCVAFVHTLAV